MNRQRHTLGLNRTNFVCLTETDIGDDDCRKIIYDVLKDGELLVSRNTIKEAKEWAEEHSYVVLES